MLYYIAPRRPRRLFGDWPYESEAEWIARYRRTTNNLIAAQLSWQQRRELARLDYAMRFRKREEK